VARGAGTVTVKFLGDISDLKKKSDDAEGVLGKVGSAVGGIAKTATLVGIPALVGFGATALKAFGESEQVAAQTGAVIKSTGGAAKVTAGHVGDLAGALSKMSGTDDEAIQSGENLLLTFTNIQDKAGKGNDIFDQATKTMLDMSTALGQDTKSSAIQLGKALNDPIKGVTALQRVGVSFTDDQQKQIKTLVESGKTMEAQKVILAELGKEFGGSAKAAGDTFAGSMNKLKVQAGNFMEDVGSKLAPFVTGFSNAFSEGGAGGAITYLVDAFKKAWPSIQAALADIMAGIGSWITGTAIPYLKAQFPVWVDALWAWIKDVTPPALKALGDLMAAIGAWLLNTGLPMLGTALLELGKALWHWIQDNTGPALGQLVDWMAQLGSWILTQGIPKLVGFLANMGVKLITWISDVAPQLPGKLGEFIGTATAWILTTGIPKLAEFTGKLGSKLLEFIATAAKDAPGELVKFVGAIGGWLKEQGPTLLGDGAKLMAAAIEAPFKLVFNTIAGFWNNTLGKISFEIPSWVPGGIGGKGFSFPTITPLATGGIVTSPTLALIGERGPEAVVPLGAGIGTTINVYMGIVGDPAGAARQIQSLLLQEKRRSGALGLA
jgi:hypothetical protein